MLTVKARCTCGPAEPFIATTIRRRDPGPGDVVIDIAYAGICHSDVEHARSLRGKTMYPIVPGHEMAGIVAAVGDAVTRFKVGDRVGVGNMVDACRECDNCRAGLEQYCSGGRTLAYNSMGRDGEPTYGGYSEKVVVDEAFVVRIPDRIPLERAAPLLCAGITMYSPLRHWQAGPGKRVAIVGFGGLGHVGVQMAHAMGAHTTVLDLSPAKREDALRFGADEYRLASDPDTFAALANSLDLIISTVPANVDLDAYLGLLARDGTYVNLAVTDKPLSLSAASLLANRRSIAGTRSGGLAQTQEMLDFCADHDIAAQVEVVSADAIDDAYRRLLAGDVRFRFVIDNSTL
ncbi:NAD(P)-dependent alcohol dehydrogenase [Cupriavidus alkaliphilus]|uniref:NAD(P)-dependent alcohol dehydrogenase n=1 Tax=Cupriavidus alkaliphilus TaxID=942866 RepID=UPI0016169703|nr:NAD(P)-dependent alcohol dehydrogenase [Cupriavidus alkaliphilus]MBB3014100.1 putative zinc-type alcohol dehydrogenase-like protein [Cupriavidus alkaliphilus]